MYSAVFRVRRCSNQNGRLEAPQNGRRPSRGDAIGLGDNDIPRTDSLGGVCVYKHEIARQQTLQTHGCSPHLPHIDAGSRAKCLCY